MNPYEVLGLPKNADDEVIRGRYRGLSRKHHPDKEGGERTQFEQIKEAYDILIDPSRRKRYDTTGRTDLSPVTPERVQIFIDSTMRSAVEASRPDGTSDDPVWDSIRDRILLSLSASRAPLKNERYKLERKLERATRMIERFKTKSDWDPVGDSLRKEKKRLEDELRINQDAFELSLEAERVFKTYEYDVGPGSEGQFNPGPTNRRLLSGSRIT